MKKTVIFKRLFFVAGTLALCATLSAQDIPTPPSGTDVFPQWQALQDDTSVNNLFWSMPGTPLATWDKAGFVHLPANFSNTEHERVSWDIKINSDMRLRRGVAFDFFCSSLKPFFYFSIYFRSGKGWYSVTFAPEVEGQWQRVVINKTEARTENSVAGWNKIDRIRISGWRGNNMDAYCAIANLGMSGDKAEAVVIRADSNMTSSSEAKSYATYATTLSDTFAAIGLEAIQLSDLDVTPEVLKEIKLVALPYNSKLPAAVASTLKGFTNAGGKLLVCYSLPAEIGELLGLRTIRSVVPEPDTFNGFAATSQALLTQPSFASQKSWRTVIVAPTDENNARVIANWRDSKGEDTPYPAITLTPNGAYIGHIWMGGRSKSVNQLMAAITDHLKPGVWQKWVEKSYAECSVLDGVGDLTVIQKEVEQSNSQDARQALTVAKKRCQEVEALIRSHKWLESQDAVEEAYTALQRAWFLTRKSKPNEHRAFWCHSAFGLPGKSWDEAIKFLKDSGFTAILPNMLWGGTTYYPSTVLPNYVELAERGDQMALCLAACKKYGIECHVWKVNWNMSRHATEQHAQEMAAAGRVQKDFAGVVHDRWLCPSHPANQDLEVAAMVELVQNYAIDGVHFDYIRYPDSNSCFCDGCRARFEALLGHPVTNWPEDTRQVAEIRESWLNFRRANIDRVVERVAQGVRETHAGVKVSAAVFGNWPRDRDSVGQDWKMWCEKGWLDFVCPMNYVDSNRAFENMVTRQLEFVGKTPIYPGIGLSCWRDPRDAVKLAQQIEITRKLGLTGFTVFNYGSNVEDVLPALRLGLTAP